MQYLELAKNDYKFVIYPLLFDKFRIQVFYNDNCIVEFDIKKDKLKSLLDKNNLS